MEEDIAPSPTTVSTSYFHSTPSQTDHTSPWREAPHDTTNIVINISSNDGSTGKGILIGMLSAFGSAAFVVLVFAIFYFFRYTNRGRIFLHRIGRPGEYDDEQAWAREEADALEDMDDLQRTEYLRAKGMLWPVLLRESPSSFLMITFYSIHPGQSARDSAHRHFTFTVLSNTGKRRVRVGIRT